MTWIQTYTGLAFELADPRPEMVCIEDIARALSQINRFTGHTDWPYSVAQHCVVMSEQIEDDKLAYLALMHDAAEAYIGDMSLPLKRMLPDYKRIEERVERAVAEAFKLPYPMPPEIKQADARMLMTEAPQLLGPTPRDWGVDAKPFDVEIELWEPPWAEQMFMERFEALVPAEVARG